MTPRTFVAGGLTFTVTLSDPVVARLKAAGFDLKRTLRKTRRLPRPEVASRLSSLLFDDVHRFGDALYAIVKDQIPRDWDGGRFGHAIICSGDVSPQVVASALIDWLSKNYVWRA